MSVHHVPADLKTSAAHACTLRQADWTLNAPHTRDGQHSRDDFCGAGKFFWFGFVIFLTLNLMCFYGVMGVYITPDLIVGTVLSAFFYGFWCASPAACSSTQWLGIIASCGMFSSTFSGFWCVNPATCSSGSFLHAFVLIFCAADIDSFVLCFCHASSVGTQHEAVMWLGATP